jgi:NAD+ synthase (glutamine-hydrolysing)
MKVALLQINPTVGDLAGNARLILDALAKAQAGGAALAVTPELALVGYLPRDLLLSEGFVKNSWDAVAALARDAARLPPLLVGLPEANTSDVGRPLFNSAVLVQHGTVGSRFRKALLPTYDVFDTTTTQSRNWFAPAPMRSSIYRHRPSPPASSRGAKKCSAAWRSVTTCRCCM